MMDDRVLGEPARDLRQRVEPQGRPESDREEHQEMTRSRRAGQLQPAATQ